MSATQGKRSKSSMLLRSSTGFRPDSSPVRRLSRSFARIPKSISSSSERTSTRSSTRAHAPGPGTERGLLDTSAVVGLGERSSTRLPALAAVSTLTLAELIAGPESARDGEERRRRQRQVLRAIKSFEALAFDVACARSYTAIYAAVLAAGRKARGAYAIDLMIAATALTHRLPLFTLNAADLRGLDGLIEIVDLS